MFRHWLRSLCQIMLEMVSRVQVLDLLMMVGALLWGFHTCTLLSTSTLSSSVSYSHKRNALTLEPFRDTRCIHVSQSPPLVPPFLSTILNKSMEDILYIKNFTLTRIFLLTKVNSTSTYCFVGKHDAVNWWVVNLGKYRYRTLGLWIKSSIS